MSDKPISLVASIDQGTQSTRFMLLDHAGQVVSDAMSTHEQFFPKPGWVQHDAMEILASTKEAMRAAMLEAIALHRSLKVVAVGITNQRETVVVWDKRTGQPLHQAIVWLDTRTSGIVQEFSEKYGGADAFRSITGTPISSYFSAFKVLWLMRNHPHIEQALRDGEALIGTIDTWLIWNLTGGADGGAFVTDVTNASRTFLMDINTCTWSDHMLGVFGIPRSCLPEIRSSSEVYGRLRDVGLSDLENVPIAGCLGDQQSACVGQGLFKKGQVKCTYGTGAFILINAGEEKVLSTHGLLTTPCYQLGRDRPVTWAIEGSIAIAGAAISWLKDNLGAIDTAQESEQLLRAIDDTEGVFFVPAFAGLFAPRWRSDARGCIVGITQGTTKAHIVRALFEAIAFQLNEIVAAMRKDMQIDSVPLLKVDGGMTKNSTFMQLNANLVQTTVEKPKNVEVTAMGAAFAAGLGVGFWDSLDELNNLNDHDTRWTPGVTQDFVEAKIRGWNDAVEKSLNWV
ncbi:unnamed protein product [Vitrella brassicaformis CCMP3155]|uniref:glycerol kinase n=2 Tax=Vitrella brassicaformis TaxID=1169539 RepID=A0A0G4G483_VITBC|nr:unnamed protein product [Vitrella brassicaformis CCMP3155]|eukprot:CEM22707.1 unnamed protein product [Vitrella brassicaformis CCMP3155]